MDSKVGIILLLQASLTLGRHALKDSPTSSTCSYALGMESGQITDSQISASSVYSSSYSPYKARLNAKSAWYAYTNDVHQWLQVDFEKITKVTGIATQSDYDSGYRVTSYTLSYSNTGFDSFTSYQQQSFTKTFPGNTDQNSVVTNSLNPAIIARFIRIKPQSWYGYITLRAEFYGCSTGFTTPKVPTCINALGMQNGQIPDSQIAASTVSSSDYPYKARLYYQEGWLASTTDTHQWLQVDFGRLTRVTGIATQSYYNADYYVISYTLSYSNTGFDSFSPYQQQSYTKIFDGNTNMNTVVKHLINPAIIARFIRINPQKWYNYISMRIELYGCTSGFTTPKVPTCINPLGLQNGRIPNSQITASTVSSSDYPYKARLYSLEGWLASTTDTHQWLQVDFGRVIRVTGIATQSYYNADYYVISYTLSYSNTGFDSFSPYQQQSYTKIFDGNTDMNTVVKHLISPAITARFIRINPQKWYNYISMRIELYGCTSGDGGYSEWGAWSQCSSTCGNGTRKRSRTCTNPPPSSTGNDCSSLGLSSQTEACHNGDCAVSVNGGYSSWGTFGQCSKSCGGGAQTRHRTCTNPPPSNGGQNCSSLGPSSSSRECNINSCQVSVNGGYSSWGTFGQCSKSCGGGAQTRHRTCTNPPPSNGGQNCSSLGPSSSSRECNINSCQDKKVWIPVGCFYNRGKAVGATRVKPLGNTLPLKRKFRKCRYVASRLKVSAFGLDDQTCWIGKNTGTSFESYGTSVLCTSGKLKAGYRRSKTVFIYQKDNNGNWKALGCYINESPTKALPILYDQNVSSVSGPDAIFDYCKAKAVAFGYTLFGADDQNCWSAVNASIAESTYNKYGQSTQCSISNTTGKGSGATANGDMYVYKLK